MRSQTSAAPGYEAASFSRQSAPEAGSREVVPSGQAPQTSLVVAVDVA
jgi:hypothetical protein